MEYPTSHLYFVSRKATVEFTVTSNVVRRKNKKIINSVK